MSLRFVAALLLAIATVAQPVFKAADKIRWNRGSFVVDQRPVILFGGSMHYFRIAETEWEPAMRRISSDGFNLIDTYVPWSLHEPEEGQFDFGSLERFLALAKRYGLLVVARPGPYLCSEFDQGGFPRWLSGKDVGFRTDREASRRWSKHWYDAVMPVLARNQVSRGGPVVMVQLENEYGHPQYIALDQKKDYLRFLYRSASVHDFDIPLMGNDIQFAQRESDPILSKIYGTVDAYFGSYQELGEMLAAQRKFNPDAPVGAAEYSLAGPEATVTTMLGLGASYFDLYMFRGGSQFGNAAKGYESSSYIVSALLEEGGYASGKYYPMRAKARFLQEFGELLAKAEPAMETPMTNDPELWIQQRNDGRSGFLFLRSDSSGVNDRTLRLETVDKQKIRYHDPQNGAVRSIPRYSTLLMQPHEARILPLNLPILSDVTLSYSTSEVLGIYRYPQRSWIVLYGDVGAEGEAAIRFGSRPSGLNRDAIWAQGENEAVVRFQFSRQDQVVQVSGGVSLLLLSRDRAYRAKHFRVENEPAMLVADANDIEVSESPGRLVLTLGWQQAPGALTVLSSRRLSEASYASEKIRIGASDDVQRLQVGTATFDPYQESVTPRLVRSWPVKETAGISMPALRSLPEVGVWRKGITQYRVRFPARQTALQLRFFSDDYHAVWLNGQVIPEASNRALETSIGTDYFPKSGEVELQIYVVDTGRPKEDLGRWRMDEKKGLLSASWVDGNALQVVWNVTFTDLLNLTSPGRADSRLTATEYTFPRPDSHRADAVWRAHVADVEALVYLNGVYLEHHQAGQLPSNTADRPGIYLPPSMLSRDNRLVIVALEPGPRLQSPRVVADPDSARQRGELILQFSPANP